MIVQSIINHHYNLKHKAYIEDMDKIMLLDVNFCG